MKPSSSLTPTVSNILKKTLGVSNKWYKGYISLLRKFNIYYGVSRANSFSEELERVKKLNAEIDVMKQESSQKLLEDVRSNLRQKDEILQALAELRETSEPSEATERERKRLQERMEMLPSVDNLALVHYLACGGLIEDAIFCVINLTLKCNRNYFFTLHFSSYYTTDLLPAYVYCTQSNR